MRASSCAMIGAALFLAATASAQETPPTIEFSFSNPGARSLGMGGAFLALADDATAAFANPAGLVQLVEPEVSVEGRSWDFSTPFTEGGRISGQPTGLGIDTLSGLRVGESEANVNALSFLSLVYPRRAWAVAVYHHQLARFEASTATQGLWGVVPGVPGDTRQADTLSSTDIDFASTSVAAAWQVTDRLSLGLGLSYFEGRILIRSENYAEDPGAFYAPNSYLPQSLIRELEIRGDDNDWGLSGGFLWQFTKRWRLGGVYRQGLTLAVDLTGRTGPLLAPGFPVGTVIPLATDSPTDFPDVYGLGAAFRSGEGTITVSFDWDRVEYSSIIESLDPAFDADSVILKDGDELHAGFEYVLLKQRPITALRVGAWLDPDHRINDRGGDIFDQALLPGGDDEIHAAAGVGFVFRRFQLDLAVDVSDLVTTWSTSVICKL